MKRLLLLSFASLMAIGSMAQTIKIPPVVSSEVTTKVKFADSIVIYVSGPNNASTRKPLYLAAYALAHTNPPVVPPIVIAKPNFAPPLGNYVSLTPVSGKTIDLSTYSGKYVRLSPGTYTNIYMTGLKMKGIVIDATGVIFTGANSIVELGDGDGVDIYNLTMLATDRRPFRFDFGLNNLHVYGLSLINCGDYAIYSNNASTTNYNGTDATLNKGLKFLNCKFDNVGQLNIGGALNGSTDNGLFKDVEIGYCSFKNINSGDIVSLSNVWGYDIHHNTGENLNPTNEQHNGIFHIQGEGKFHDNKFTNYQGNSLRLWAYSRGKTSTTSEIYNNICYNTRKYSGFEIQEFDRNFIAGKSTFSNFKVYNNTVGKMDTSKGWEGQLLDLYPHLGIIEYYNNLGFELNYSKGEPGNMINSLTDSKNLSEQNNKYFKTWQEAISDLITFKSKLPIVGVQ